MQNLPNWTLNLSKFPTDAYAHSSVRSIGLAQRVPDTVLHWNHAANFKQAFQASTPDILIESGNSLG